MGVGNLFMDDADRRFHFEYAVPWPELLELKYPERFEGLEPEAKAAEVERIKKTYRIMLELTGKYLAEVVAPSGPEIDRLGVLEDGTDYRVNELMERNIRIATEMGTLGVSLPTRYHGLGAPEFLNAVIGEMFSEADTSTMIQWSFYAAPAKLILLFGDEEQKSRLVPPLARGDISSAVAMTEPDAGSDVGAVRALALPHGDSWRLTGTKQFISSGLSEMAIVLARSDPDSKGLEGLSLFIVPRYLETDRGRVDNYIVGKPETKLGIHGAPTCELSFNDSRCELLGGDGDGFKEILAFMNEARVGVGMQALGIAQSAFNKALEYARTREQMGKAIARHELVADMLLDMDVRIKGMRSLVYEAMVQFDLLEACEHGAARTEDPEAKEALEQRAKNHMRRLRELTPLVKYYCAEQCIAISRTAIQVHGGYGVMREVGVERILRDSMATAIYEGTSQIQSLMALKDTFKAVFANPAGFGRRLQKSLGRKAMPGGGVSGAVNEAEWEILTALGAILFEVMGKKVGADFKKLRGSGPFAVVDYLRKGKYMKGIDDFSYGLQHAERMASMLSQWHILKLLKRDADTARKLLEEAEASENKKRIAQAQKLVRDRDMAAHRFAFTALADIKKLGAMIRSGDRSTLEYIAVIEEELGISTPEPADPDGK